MEAIPLHLLGDYSYHPEIRWILFLVLKVKGVENKCLPHIFILKKKIKHLIFLLLQRIQGIQILLKGTKSHRTVTCCNTQGKFLYFVI